MISRDPRPSLSPFVKTLWASDGSGEPRPGARELVLPTGEMHLVFRLSDDPLRLFRDAADCVGRTVGHAILGGARAAPYVRDVSQPARSVGAQLRPGVARLLLGVPADELAERHTPLEDLWGRAAREMRERLQELSSPERRLDMFESFLAARLPSVRGIHPAVAEALERFALTPDVGPAVRDSGYSHRRFVALFREGVGLTPKLYCRVLRFQRALRLLATEPGLTTVNMAIDIGYSDQPHFTREFREFAGLSPGEYRRLSPAQTHHVPIRPSTSTGPRGQLRSRQLLIR